MGTQPVGVGDRVVVDKNDDFAGGKTDQAQVNTSHPVR